MQVGDRVLKFTGKIGSSLIVMQSNLSLNHVKFSTFDYLGYFFLLVLMLGRKFSHFFIPGELWLASQWLLFVQPTVVFTEDLFHDVEAPFSVGWVIHGTCLHFSPQGVFELFRIETLPQFKQIILSIILPISSFFFFHFDNDLSFKLWAH